jgi:alpha-L-fucosidase 2
MTQKNIFILLSIFALLSCNHKEKQPETLKLWYEQPAKDWNEALPVGNGRLGAMVFGTPESEHLQLNEETVWAGGPHNNVNPETAPYLIKVRNLIFAGKYAESHKVANENIKSYQNGMPFQTMGDLYLKSKGCETYTDYYRELDISNAIAKVRFKVNDTEYTREIFSSFPDQVIIVRLTANKPSSINFDMALTSPQKHNLTVQDNQVIMKGITTDHEGIPGQVKFTTIARPIIRNGDLVPNDTTLSIVNANEVVIYISAGTNFKNYHDISGDPDAAANTHLALALNSDYQTAKANHISFYKSYFDRVKLDLGTTDSIHNPTNIRIQQFKEGNDPQLAALYFQYGRYLLISSSQPGGQPATLQGIWNHMLNPPWESKYTININCEMNYWPAEVTNLTELSEPLFQMIKDLSATGRESARTLYHARGWVAHHNTDIWRVTGIFDRATYGMWQSGGNWLSQHLWQHYLFTGDTAFLKEYYPIMKSAAQFFVDDLVEEPHTGYLVISPSNSPENKYMNIASSSAGTTMDNELMFDLFSNVIRSSQILGADKEFADTLRQLKKRLAPLQIGQYNQLQEWLYDWDDPNDKHRHVSHLYGLYPSNQISPYRNPDLFQAAKQSLIYRGDESTGWSMGWKVNLWARLLDGNHALKLIKDQISPAKKPNGEVNGGTYPNLLDAHPPFQIDGNFGCTAGIAEMLLQSQDGFVFILPALPDEWQNGSVKGLKARGGFEFDLAWEHGQLKTFTVYSELGGNLRLRTKDDITSPAGTTLKLAEGDNPNPLFAVNIIQKPLVSKKANVKPLVLDKTYLYDIPTKKGATYTFSIKR